MDFEYLTRIKLLCNLTKIDNVMPIKLTDAINSSYILINANYDAF